MSELINVRCRQGKLIITENVIKIQLSSIKEQSLARSALTSIDSAMGAPSVFGKGGGTNLTFHGQGGAQLKADLVPPSEAQKIKELLGY